MKEGITFKADNIEELYRMVDGVSGLITSWKDNHPNYDSSIVVNEDDLVLEVELCKNQLD